MKRNDARSSEAGYTMLAVIGIFVVLTILGMSIILLSSAAVKTSTKERDDQAVFYTAESGITVQINEIGEIIRDIYDGNPSITEDTFYLEVQAQLDGQEFPVVDFEEVNGRENRAKVRVNLVPETINEYMMESTGLIGGESDILGQAERTVENTFVVQWNEREISGQIPPYALLTRGEMRINNGTISGDIGSFGKTLDAAGNEQDLIGEHIKFVGSANVVYEDSIYIREGDTNYVRESGLRQDIDYTIEPLEAFPFPELPDAPAIPTGLFIHPNTNQNNVINDGNLRIDWGTSGYTLNVDKNLYFKSIQMPYEGLQLNIDLHGEDRIIVVDNLLLHGAYINILPGSGRLTLFVVEKMQTSGTPSINHYSGLNEDIHALTNTIDRLNVFYYGDGDISLSGNGKLYGSIYLVSPKANLLLNSGSGGIFGNILMTGESFIFGAGSEVTNQLVLAPNAKVTFTEKQIRGSIIAKELDMDHGASMVYVPPQDMALTGPLSFEAIQEHNESNTILYPAEPTVDNITPIKEKRN